MSKWSFWIDRGGTFTDSIALDPTGKLLISKHLSINPSKYKDATIHSIKQFLSIPKNKKIPTSLISEIKVGTTVATNALLERKGARTVLVVTKGFEDQLRIGYQNRPDIFARKINLPDQLYEKVVSVEERILADGKTVIAPDVSKLKKELIKCIKKGITSCAILLMHGYKYVNHEKTILELAYSLGFKQVSASHEISPQIRFVERGDTTVIDAYLTPVLKRYVEQLVENFSGDLGHKLKFMQSNGGLISKDLFRGKDAVLSGPAGGVVGAVEVSKKIGENRIIGFDMGGTSTDVSLCDQNISLTTESKISGVPIQIPMIDIHTVGAGGGSIAQVDIGGALKVGPESAGADPGPACYGRGDFPTVTDANMFLGRIEPNHFLGGKMELYSAHSTRVINKLAQQIGKTQTDTAEGILQIANATMSRAIRRVSVERGYDPNDFALFSYGGAGGLHACFLAESLSIPTVIVPPHGGLMSAMGMLLADTVKDYSQTVLWSMDQDIFQRLSNRFSQLKLQADQEMQLEGISSDLIQYQLSLDLRYVGQSYELNVPFETEFDTLFHQLHKQRFGHSRPDFQIEIVHLRLRAVGLNEQADIGKNPKFLEQDSQATGQPFTQKVVAFGQPLITNFYYRRDLLTNETISSPAIVFELSATTAIPPNFTGYVDAWRNLILSPV